jgi:hypothetical protein
MAGPSLYSLVQNGELDSSTAIGRGLVVAGVCAAGAAYVLSLVRNYEREGERKEKHEKLMAALAEAEEAAKRRAAAMAAAEESAAQERNSERQ